MTGLEEPLAAGVARPLKNRRSRWLFAVPLAALLILSIVVLPLVFPDQVLSRLGDSLVVSDRLEHADLIYVLAGDFWGSRVLLGANLGSQGWAPRVILSGGLYQGREVGDMSVEFAVQHGYSRSLFLPLRMDAPSTVEEAQIIGPVFHRLGARRIILVTSNFHSRRTAEVFRLFLPEFDFRVEGSVDPEFDPHAWWTKPRQRSLFFSEYRKIAGTFLVRFHLASAGWLRQGSQ